MLKFLTDILLHCADHKILTAGKIIGILCLKSVAKNVQHKFRLAIFIQLLCIRREVKKKYFMANKNFFKKSLLSQSNLWSEIYKKLNRFFGENQKYLNWNYFK